MKLKERMQNSFFALSDNRLLGRKKARNFICIIVPCFYSCACDNGGMVYRKRYGKY